MITPPTDSLYKFLAISGLILLIWGGSVPWQKSQNLKLELIQLQVTAEKQRQKRLDLKRLSDTLKQDLIETRKVKDAEERLVLISSIVKRQEANTAGLIAAKIPLGEKLARVAVLEDEASFLGFIGVISSAAGLLLGVSGFVLWYIQVQRHIDKSVAPKKPPPSFPRRRM